MGFYQKGANFERSLVREFWKNGFAAMRAAGSGSAPLPLPDIIAIRGDRVLIVECKTTSKDSLRLDRHDLEKMRVFRERADCEAYIAVKFNKLKPRFYPLELLRGTRISKSEASITFETLVGEQRTL